MKIRRQPVKPEYSLIENIDFNVEELNDEYENIEFKNCIFPKLAGIEFTDCAFNSCNLGNVRVTNSKMQGVRFINCKLIGINFHETKTFGFAVEFENCILDYASFDNRKMNQSAFINCKMHGVNFSNADLSKSRMERCDLDSAIFSYSVLSGMDFTTNYNFSIDPQINTLKKTRFTLNSLPGLLRKYDLDIQF